MSIIFDAVTKQFGDSTVALDTVTFVVTPGELVIITGPSGSGKTTLMRLLIHEYTPESGEITFLDTPLSKLKSGQIPYHRRQIGVVFQDYKLLPELNIWENIALPLSIIGKDQTETESRVTDLLKLVGLETKAHLFPSQLSGGEAQRISIARALATGPSVIFADEPTGNLDPEASLDIIKLLRQINRLGTTILLATHDAVVLEFLKKERRLTLRQGKLATDTQPRPLPGGADAANDVNDTPSDESSDKSNEVPVDIVVVEKSATDPKTKKLEIETTTEVESLDDEAEAASDKPVAAQAETPPPKSNFPKPTVHSATNSAKKPTKKTHHST